MEISETKRKLAEDEWWIAGTYLLSAPKERRKMIRMTTYCEMKVMAGTAGWPPVR
jgi:hypothetical protein